MANDSRIDLRLPAALERQIEVIAEREHRSRNAQILVALIEHVRAHMRAADLPDRTGAMKK